jgi:3-oxoadipate enol-lactonase
LSPSGMEQHPALIAKLRNIIMGNQISGIIGDLMAMEERTDFTPLARMINLPALVLVGEDDIPSPPAEMKGMAKHITGAKMIVIPRAGHVSNLENSEAFNAALRQFLENL